MEPSPLGISVIILLSLAYLCIGAYWCINALEKAQEKISSNGRKCKVYIEYFAVLLLYGTIVLPTIVILYYVVLKPSFTYVHAVCILLAYIGTLILICYCMKYKKVKVPYLNTPEPDTPETPEPDTTDIESQVGNDGVSGMTTKNGGSRKISV